MSGQGSSQEIEETEDWRVILIEDIDIIADATLKDPFLCCANVLSRHILFCILESCHPQGKTRSR